MIRDHEPIVIEDFNGLWRRGDEDSCPIDHFSDCNNIQFIESGFETRDGLDTFIARGNVLRIYNYKLPVVGESIIGLVVGGSIYHSLVDGSNTIYGPILTIPDMTDFGFISINGRAYITPFGTFTDTNGKKFQKGLENEFVYVYKGDGTPARKAAGNPPTGGNLAAPMAYNSGVNGVIDQGIHVIGISYYDGAQNSTALGVSSVIYSPGQKEAIVNSIPTGPGGVTARRIYMTRAIDPKDWNPTGDIFANYTFYLAATISNNIDTDAIISASDADLTTAFVAGALSTPVSSAATVANSDQQGYCDLGLHAIGVVYETDTGYLTAPGPEFLAMETFVNENRAVHITGIPTSPDSFVVRRHLVSSVAIANFNGNNRTAQFAAQLFFIPGGTIEDNTTTELTVSYYDADLIDDASHLIDNFAEIPAGVTLATYHNRLVLTTTFNDVSLIYLSAPGEPEAIDQVDGQCIMPLDGLPVTNAQEFRDVLYTFKKTRTMAWVDNGDVPSTWQGNWIDQGVGASIHGIAFVLDSGGVNIDFLMIVDWSGIMIFNGFYTRPELTWKIQDFWFELDRNDFANIQIMNDSLTQKLYMTLPNKRILMGDYKNGLNPKDIRWTPWSFDIQTTTITLIDTNVLVIGSDSEFGHIALP